MIYFMTLINYLTIFLICHFFSTKRVDNSNSRLMSQIDKDTGKSLSALL